jgi:hypothetical protein
VVVMVMVSGVTTGNSIVREAAHLGVERSECCAPACGSLPDLLYFAAWFTPPTLLEDLGDRKVDCIELDAAMNVAREETERVLTMASPVVYFSPTVASADRTDAGQTVTYSGMSSVTTKVSSDVA